MNLQDNINAYADLTVQKGVALQKGQELVISAPIELADFARRVAKSGWANGASDVIMIWRDDEISRLRFQNASKETLSDKTRFKADLRLIYGKRNAAFVTIIGEDPQAFASVDPDNVTLQSRTGSAVLKPYYDLITANKVRWTIVAAPTELWAKCVLPNSQNPIDELWDIIFKTVRIYDDDPAAAWEKHKENLNKRADYLNKKAFKTLKYKNGLGTDFCIDLPKNHSWSGAGDSSPDGVHFFPNMPTEEIFTLPDKRTANGTLVASMPLSHNGINIRDFSITFKDGKVTDYSAKEGYNTLKGIIETDEGSSFLGEVALVPYDSPISNLNLLFYETLFDENASCHFALGEAYPCFTDVDDIDKDEMVSRGMNESLEHVDFMVGTNDLSIIGIENDGTETPIFENGNFAF